MKNAGPWSAVGCGGAMAVAGAVFLAMYVLEAVVRRIGDSDQSLLFWYLPILFTGAGCLLLGLAAAVWGVRRLRRAGRDQ